jgi:hypothetical protein
MAVLLGREPRGDGPDGRGGSRGGRRPDHRRSHRSLARPHCIPAHAHRGSPLRALKGLECARVRNGVGRIDYSATGLSAVCRQAHLCWRGSASIRRASPTRQSPPLYVMRRGPCQLSCDADLSSWHSHDRQVSRLLCAQLSTLDGWYWRVLWLSGVYRITFGADGYQVPHATSNMRTLARAHCRRRLGSQRARRRP